MRNDESDPADDAAAGHGERRDNGRRNDGDIAQPRGIDSERTRLLLTERENVDPLAHCEKERPRRDHREPDDFELVKVRLGKAPHQPIGDGWQFVIGIGGIFDQ